MAAEQSTIEEGLRELVPFWAALEPDQRTFLSQRSRRMRFDAGAHVQGAGAGCAGVVFVRSGRLRAFMLSNQGREVTLFHVQPGECCVLAASCILPMITFDIALDAAEDSDLLVIDSHAFGTVSQENIHAEAFTYRQATERFSDCMWVMQQVLFMGLDARLAIWLLDEVARGGSRTIYATHDEIARHLGSAREAVSRMLKYFAREGLVSLSRGSVEIIDVKRLRRLTV
ncbi:Crp/Fnr family transcriptional regulator [Collinsella intestinalis]|uniref:Crp/Fnr family transcriptional regulator n=1 Tax=Collinsella intestinalis TaxID=147207 RepID=UPI0022E636B6|nr:Crp/Fnr family transcriptional regulator [Collinsella intestinalis]